MEGSAQNKYHVEHYGTPSKFGYKDITPLWKAEKWNPNQLMALYKSAGAKYFVSMGSYHDNFFLWNSKIHQWNSVNMGPHKDVVGLWQKAAKKQGLCFGVSEHLAAWKIYGEGPSTIKANQKRGRFGGLSDTRGYQSTDFRFTTKACVLYAFDMAVPDGNIHLTSLGKNSKYMDKPIVSVTLLGSKEKLKWVQGGDVLVITKSANFPPGKLPAIKLSLKNKRLLQKKALIRIDQMIAYV